MGRESFVEEVAEGVGAAIEAPEALGAVLAGEVLTPAQQGAGHGDDERAEA
jgi:hypothetical protein